MKEIRSITLLGAGSLSANLIRAFRKAGLTPEGIYSRHPEHAARLACREGIAHSGGYQQLNTRSDLVLIAVPDSAIGMVAESIPPQNGMLAHTSGTVPLQVLIPFSKKAGVFYPLQTFPAGKRTSFRKVPVCIEASDIQALKALQNLGSLISEKVVEMNSDNRMRLHLAAVFASNFTNFMFSISCELLDSVELDHDLLVPLIQTTISNYRARDVFGRQTGPALREDHTLMEMHLELLKEKPEYAEIYRMISMEIIRKKRQHGKL